LCGGPVPGRAGRHPRRGRAAGHRCVSAESLTMNGDGTAPAQPNALDDHGLIATADPSAMLGLIAQIPAHLRDAWAITRRLELGDAARATTSAVLLGMG